jgi:hypothetical protein
MALDILFPLFIVVTLLFDAKVVTIFRIPKLFSEKLDVFYNIKEGVPILAHPLIKHLHQALFIYNRSDREPVTSTHVVVNTNRIILAILEYQHAGHIIYATITSL